MAIFNSYVKLPEGKHSSVIWMNSKNPATYSSGLSMMTIYGANDVPITMVYLRLMAMIIIR